MGELYQEEGRITTNHTNHTDRKNGCQSPKLFVGFVRFVVIPLHNLSLYNMRIPGFLGPFLEFAGEPWYYSMVKGFIFPYAL
jgi:hypothetical protein